MRKITQAQIEAIRKHIWADFDSMDERFPSSLCSQHRIAINNLVENVTNNRTIKLFDYKTINLAKRSSERNNSGNKCECGICVAARVIPQNQPKVKRLKSKLNLCEKCLTNLRRGKTHNCKPSIRIANAVELAKASPPKGDEKIVTSIIKDKISKLDVKEPENFSFATLSGKSMRLNVNSKKVKPESQITIKDISKMQVAANLSENQVKLIFLRNCIIFVIALYFYRY